MACYSFLGRPGIKKAWHQAGACCEGRGMGCKQILKNRRQQITRQTKQNKSQSTGHTPTQSKHPPSTNFFRVAATGVTGDRVTMCFNSHDIDSKAHGKDLPVAKLHFINI